MPNNTAIKTTNVTGTASGKTITRVLAYSHGSTDVCEIVHSTGTLFVKFHKGIIEIGGTNEMGTGTVQK